ncbi:MAG: hypothetical protein Q8L74_16590 [Nitrospirota bacterium]|nr:hypothetical protein [Nitrospirota bacterium]MDP2384542.1 hypothetical protein [Nitrospirota bacterium]MDP3596633.1 hypothetical protein [Nitrospirota bacterium]
MKTSYSRASMTAILPVLALCVSVALAEEGVTERAVPALPGTIQPVIPLPMIVNSLVQHLGQLESDVRAAQAALNQPGINPSEIVTTRFPQLAALARMIGTEARSTRALARAETQLQLEEQANKLANESEAISRGMEEARAKAQQATHAATNQMLLGIIAGVIQSKGAVAAFQGPATQNSMGTSVIGAGAMAGVAGSFTGVGAGTASLEQHVAFLQQQVQTLIAQVAALQSVLIVTPTGATLQAPTLSLLSIDGTTIRSSKGIAVEAGNSIDMKSAAGTRIRAGSTASVEAGGTLDLKGALIKLNGGTKPLATVGSQVQVPGQPIGHVATGSQSVLGN